MTDVTHTSGAPLFLPPHDDAEPMEAEFTPAQMMEAAGAFLEAPEKDSEHEYALPAPTPPPPDEAPVQPMWAGTYAVYDDGAGGVVLVLGQSTGQTLHHRIPAGLIKMAERFGGGGLANLFGGR